MNQTLRNAAKQLLLLLLGASLGTYAAFPACVNAQGVIFVDAMEDPVPPVLFPVQNGNPVLPPGPATTQLSWLLEQLAVGADTSEQEISSRFSPAWLSSIPAAQTRDFIASVRDQYPNARIIDIVGIGPMQFTGLIAGDTNNEAFVTFETTFASGLINRFGVNFFGTGEGSVVFAADADLDLQQAADKFTTLSTEPGLLVARVDDNDLCTPLVERNPETLRATASIVKIWVMGGVADAIADRSISTDQVVLLAEAEKTPGGPVVNEPVNTAFTVDQLSQLMLGISDNTATDLLHELVGRERLDRIINEFGHASAEVLTPLLAIGEQFHLLFSVSAAAADNFLNGTEQFQQQYIDDEIVPLGSFAANRGSFSNLSLLTGGTWRASAMDVCNALASHRTWAQGSDQMLLVDRALGAQAAQPRVRQQWDRVWYKGGSLAQNNGGLAVLTHAWLLENAGEQPWVVVGLSNSPSANIDVFAVQSILGRILQLAAQN